MALWTRRGGGSVSAASRAPQSGTRRRALRSGNDLCPARSCFGSNRGTRESHLDQCRPRSGALPTGPALRQDGKSRKSRGDVQFREHRKREELSRPNYYSSTEPPLTPTQERLIACGPSFPQCGPFFEFRSEERRVGKECRE